MTPFPPSPPTPPPAAQSLAYPASASLEDMEASPLIRAIKSKSVDMVVNLGPHAASTHPAGNALLRRATVDHGIPLLTNIKVAALLADSLEKHSRNPMVGLVPKELEKYYKAEAVTEAWTGPTEFH